jgi:hypothetical protein
MCGRMSAPVGCRDIDGWTLARKLVVGKKLVGIISLFDHFISLFL